MHRSEQDKGSAPSESGLEMAPSVMLDLARKATQLVVKRIEGLPGENAWDGDFQQVLEQELLEDPPEVGRPATEVMERAASKVLPFAARLDHSRCFGFIPSSPTWPSVLADFMAAGYNINAGTWLFASGPSQLELVVIGLGAALDRLSGERRRAVDDRELGGQPRGARYGAGGGRLSRAGNPCT